MGIIDNYLQRRGFVKADDLVSKSAGFMPLETATYPDGRPDADKIADYSTFVRAFRTLPWIFAGATALAIAATKPVLRVYREVKGKDGKVSQEEVEGEAINDLIEMPNAQLSYRELIQVSVINLWLLGNQYWNLVGTQEKAPISPSNQPVEIWWVKPEQIFPKVDKNGVLVSYEFTGASGQIKQLDPSEVIHFRTANPGSYFVGMGVMEPLTKTATLELNAMTFMDNFMKNDGTPPFLLEHPGSPDKKQRSEFWAAWDERHKGPKKANRAAMIWGGMKYVATGQTVKDAQYSELRKMNREEMLAALGVPPSVVGLLEYANYSNMEVQQKKFWEDAAIPILGLFADKLSLRLAPYFDERYWFEYDFSGIKVLQEDEERKARVNRMRLGCGTVTPNQLRKEENQDPYEGGDQYYVDMSLVPVGADAKASAAAPPKQLKGTAKKDDEEKPKVSFWAEPNRKQSLWEHYDKRLSSSTRAFGPLVESYLKAQADDVKAKMQAAESSDHMRAAGVFDAEAEAQAYIGKFEGRYRFTFERAGEAAYHATKGKLWIPPEERRIKDEDTFSMRPEHVAQLKAQIEKSARFFNDTTWKIVQTEIKNGLENNLTTEQMAQELWQSLIDRAPWEARRIAATEMTRTEGFGTHEGYKQNDQVDMQGWSCSMLATSRDDHVAADGQEVGIDEDFKIGGYPMAYPGDERAPAGEVCNCRCSTYPVVGAL